MQLERIETEVKSLTRKEKEALRDWLENLLEDELEFTEEFKAKIDQGEKDLRDGRDACGNREGRGDTNCIPSIR